MGIDASAKGRLNWKRILFRCFMSFLPIIALIAFESGTRVFFWIEYGVPGKRYGIWRRDPDLGAIHKENAYNSMGETNNMGFRNREDVYDPKPAESLRIMAYGGSMTFCYQLHTEEAWPARLEQTMRSQRVGGEKDQVLNAGAVMWSIGHAYARAQREIPILKPDYVLIYSGANEPANTELLEEEGISMEQLVKQGRFGVFTKHLSQASWIKRELFTFKIYEKYVAPKAQDALSAVMHSPPETYPSGPIPYVLENYLHVLGEMIQLVKESGGQPVFVVEITGAPSEKTLYVTSYSRGGAKYAAEHGALVIDPSPILEGSPEDAKSLFVETGVHYSEPGARKFASFLFDRLFAGHTGP